MIQVTVWIPLICFICSFVRFIRSSTLFRSFVRSSVYMLYRLLFVRSFVRYVVVSNNCCLCVVCSFVSSVVWPPLQDEDEEPVQQECPCCLAGMLSSDRACPNFGAVRSQCSIGMNHLSQRDEGVSRPSFPELLAAASSRPEQVTLRPEGSPDQAAAGAPQEEPLRAFKVSEWLTTGTLAPPPYLASLVGKSPTVTAALRPAITDVQRRLEAVRARVFARCRNAGPATS